MGLFEQAVQSQQDQSEEDKKLVRHVKEKVEEARSSSHRIAHESIWMTNIAYLLGYDGIKFNSTTRQFQPVNKGAFPKQSRIHVNKILPTVQNRLARLCKNPPKYDVRPESDSTDDKEAARLSLQVLTAMWEKLSLDKKRLVLKMWVQQCGHAWMKISWDPSLGKGMVDPSTGQFSYEGDVRADVTSPFEIFPDPMARSDDDVYETWMIQAKVRKLDYFKTMYPEKGKLVKSEDAWLLSAQYESRINSINSQGPAQGSTVEAMKDSAIELVKYEARSKEFPNGRMIVTANGILLANDELPVGMIPFAKYDDILIGGKFNSESIITHLRPLQDNYNETKRRTSAWMRKFLAGKYKAPRGSGLAQESLNDDENGEVVYYTVVPNAPNGPEAVQVPALPQWALQLQDQDVSDINDISGISEVSRGTLPSASVPAIGMSLLTEQDDTRIGVITEQHEHADSRVGQLILKFIEVGYKLPRKLKFAGSNLAYAVKEISGSDLKGNTDVIVIRGSTQPGSKTLKRQDIMNTYQAGLLGDPADPKVREKVLSMIEFGDAGEMWQDYGLDMSQIKRGLEQMEQGMPVPANEFDNNALWLQEMNRFRKGDKFGTLAPEIQALFAASMEERIQMIMKTSNMVPPPPDLIPPGGPPPEGGAPEEPMPENSMDDSTNPMPTAGEGFPQ